MNTKQHPTALQALERIVSYLADLNGSEWIKGDGPGERDMRQRAKALQSIGFEALQRTREEAAATLAQRSRYERLHDALSDCIEAGRLKPSALPEDYAVLVQLLAEISAAQAMGGEGAQAESLAEARVKAAAPDMLAALHKALDEVDADQAEGYEAPAWAATARAAVAKAVEGTAQEAAA